VNTSRMARNFLIALFEDDDIDRTDGVGSREQAGLGRRGPETGPHVIDGSNVVRTTSYLTST